MLLERITRDVAFRKRVHSEAQNCGAAVHRARCTVHGARCTVHGARCSVLGGTCSWLHEMRTHVQDGVQRRWRQSIHPTPDVETINPIDPKYRRRQVRPDKNKTPEGPPCTRDWFVFFGERSAMAWRGVCVVRGGVCHWVNGVCHWVNGVCKRDNAACSVRLDRTKWHLHKNVTLPQTRRPNTTRASRSSGRDTGAFAPIEAPHYAPFSSLLSLPPT